MSYDKYFKRFWEQYSQEISDVAKIHQLFESRGEKIPYMAHDHLALRTFNDPRVGIDKIIKPFLDAGYIPGKTYHFEEKKLFARHYEPPKPGAPRVFISELLLEEFSPEFQAQVKKAIDKIPQSILDDPENLFLSKTPWAPLSFDVYQQLLKESQYGAWMYAFGFRTNHFAMHVNDLKTFENCEEINTFLKEQGYQINDFNGEVKGSPKDLLEQSSIMAIELPIEFDSGIHKVPSCYYEFTKRFKDENGKLYQGFVAASADKIFQSTDTDDSTNKH